MSGPHHVVYDCMIFLQAAATPQRVHGTMRLVAEGRVQLCVSEDIIAELRDVLTRPEIKLKFPALSVTHVDAFLDQVLSVARIVRTVPSHFALPRDKKDEPYINLAIEVNARYLVTWNEKHLTYLMKQDTPEGRDFCQRFPEITIIDPPAFIRDMQQRQPIIPPPS